MKKILFVLCILLTGLFNPTKAQDTIVFKNGESKIAKIIQVKSDEISCKDLSYLDGPDFVYKLSKIKEIHFKNGFTQTYDVSDNVDVQIDSIVVKKRVFINDVPVTSEERDADNTTLPEGLENFGARSEYYGNVPYHKEYGDPYSPVLAGLASYFIPGLGQMICGETGRGLAFMGGVVGSYVVMLVGVSNIAVESGLDYSYYGGYKGNYSGSGMSNSTASILALGGAVATLGVYIWSIADAVHVAKINNLYARDLHRQSQLKIKLAPFVDASKTTLALNKKPALGLSVRLSF